MWRTLRKFMRFWVYTSWRKMFSRKISRFPTYFLVFGSWAKNIILKAFVYNLEKYYGRWEWGGHNQCGISQVELVFPTFIRELIFPFSYSGGPDYVLMAKLKDLEGKIKEWSKTTKGNLKMQKANVLNQLVDLDEIQEQRAPF